MSLSGFLALVRGLSPVLTSRALETALVLRVGADLVCLNRLLSETWVGIGDLDW